MKDLKHTILPQKDTYKLTQKWIGRNKFAHVKKTDKHKMREREI